MGSPTYVHTPDGTVLARDPATGIVVSGVTLPEALAGLRRRSAAKSSEPA